MQIKAASFIFSKFSKRAFWYKKKCFVEKKTLKISNVTTIIITH